MNSILFFSIGSHIPEGRFYADIGKQLQARGVQVTIATLARKEYLELQGSRIFSTIWMREAFKRHIGRARAELAIQRERISNDYGLFGLRTFWISDWSKLDSTEQEMDQKTVATFLAWEETLQRVKPDVVVSDFGGEIMRRSLPRVAKRLGIAHVYLDWSPFRGYFGLHSNELNHWDHLQVEDGPLDTDQQTEINSYLAEVHAQQISAVRFWTPEVTPQRMQRLAHDLWREYVIERGEHDQYTPTRWFREYLQRLAKLPLVRQYYQQPVPNERYVFYPLHHAADAQLTVRAPAFLHQEYLIEWISRSLPDGYQLYIKEHPNFIARYSLEVYRKLSSLPNVRLLSPYIHPHELIRSAAAVVTVNSTAGFEALLYHKPVVVLGNVSYRGYGATIDVTDVHRLPEYIHQALSSPPATWKIDRFLWSMRQASFPGKLYDFSSTNIANVATALQQYCREFGTVALGSEGRQWSLSSA